MLDELQQVGFAGAVITEEDSRRAALPGAVEVGRHERELAIAPHAGGAQVRVRHHPQPQRFDGARGADGEAPGLPGPHRRAGTAGDAAACGGGSGAVSGGAAATDAGVPCAIRSGRPVPVLRVAPRALDVEEQLGMAVERDEEGSRPSRRVRRTVPGPNS
jgi:hypothetical protein